MRIICVICTEIFAANSQISAVHCGHLFHEDCLSKWLNSGQKTCPQCRSAASSKTVIKKLYVTECTSGSGFSQAALNDQPPDRLLEEIAFLRDELKQQQVIVENKNELIDQKDKKIKDLDSSSAGWKKNLNEYKSIIDCFKSEIKTLKTYKEQYEAADKKLKEIESKNREFKCIDLIYQQHENAFATEMKKYLTHMSGTSEASVGVIQQLVRCNVLLKEHSDKQMEEKRLIRKKLLQFEKVISTKEKQSEDKETEIAKLKEANARLEETARSNEEELKNMKRRNDALKSAIDSPSCGDNVYKGFLKRLVNESPMPNFKTYQDEMGADESHVINSTISEELENQNNETVNNAESVTQLNRDLKESYTPELLFPKKRKNPFAIENEMVPAKQNRFNLNEHVENETKTAKENRCDAVINLSDEDESDVHIVKPMNGKKPTSLHLKPATTNTGGSKLVRSTSSASYAYDGLGGRTKIFASSSLQKQTSTNEVSAKKIFISNLCRSKVTKSPFSAANKK